MGAMLYERIEGRQTSACILFGCLPIARMTMPTKRFGTGHAEVTANTCLGTKAAVREQVDAFFASLQERKEEGKRRCRSMLQAEATALAAM
jgi:hypothetical protein